jgi:hypothetical protein
MEQTNTGPVPRTDTAAPGASASDAFANYQQLLLDRLECLKRLMALRAEFRSIEDELVQAYIADLELKQQIAAVEALRPDFKARRVPS